MVTPLSRPSWHPGRTGGTRYRFEGVTAARRRSWRYRVPWFVARLGRGLAVVGVQRLGAHAADDRHQLELARVAVVRTLAQAAGDERLVHLEQVAFALHAAHGAGGAGR